MIPVIGWLDNGLRDKVNFALFKGVIKFLCSFIESFGLNLPLMKRYIILCNQASRPVHNSREGFVGLVHTHAHAHTHVHTQTHTGVSGAQSLKATTFLLNTLVVL